MKIMDTKKVNEILDVLCAIPYKNWNGFETELNGIKIKLMNRGKGANIYFLVRDTVIRENSDSLHSPRAAAYYVLLTDYINKRKERLEKEENELAIIHTILCGPKIIPIHPSEYPQIVINVPSEVTEEKAEPLNSGPKQTDSLLNFADFMGHSDTFIETGTCYGRSVKTALDCGYASVLSVEAKDDYFSASQDKFKDDPRVKLFHGKSVDRLPEMLEGITKPCVFWLDAHVSGENSAGYQDWVEKQNESDYHQHKILKKELEIILANNLNHVIIMDDQNGINPENQEYMDTLLKANPKYKFYLYDEQMGDMFYKDKILVAIPE